MKTMKILPLIFIFISPLITPQSDFNLEAYKQFLQIHSNMGTQDLLNMHAAGVFYGEASIDYTDAEYFHLIDSNYNLTTYEKNLISRNGFMVSERLKQMTFGHAFLQIYNQDLPVYISTDAILHALHQSYDRILKEIEVDLLINNVQSILDLLHSNLSALHLKYASNPAMLQVLKDVDIYLTVPRKLFNNSTSAVYPENLPLIEHYLEQINSASGLADEYLFSENCRRVDWSQFKPRGHYTDEFYPALAKYFQSMMWLGRTELYLMKPDNVYPICQPSFSDVQRQSMMAMLIYELSIIANTVNKYYETESILKYFVGDPDNVTLADIGYLQSAIGITSADALLDSLKFIEFQDTLKNQSFAYQKILSQVLYSDPMSPDSIVPASAFLFFGQRFVIDSYVMASVVFDRITYNGYKVCRLFPSTLDPIFALGNNAAAQLLTTELDKYNYATNLAGLRYLIDSYENSFWESTIYNQWLNGIRKLNPPDDRGSLPLYMKTAAFWQKQLNTQLASWTQLRHDNLLYAKQSYTGGTVCSFPYTYIEPFPEFYEAIKTIGTVGKQKFGQLNIQNKKKFIDYFNELETICDTLKIISEKELSGTPYTDEEVNFLHTVIYHFNGGSGDPPYKGWYPRMLFDDANAQNALLKVDYLVADVHTVPTDCGGMHIGSVVHVGTGPMNMGVFIAEVPGFRKTAFIGPVYSYYEYNTLNFKRLTDEEWLSKYLYISARPDWVNVYLADTTGNWRGSGASLITDLNEIQNDNPVTYLIVENYPNPFNPVTTIAFNVPYDKSSDWVTVQIFSVQGELIDELYTGELPRGNYYLRWEGKNSSNAKVSSGVYLCKVTVGDIFKTIKMTLLK